MLLRRVDIQALRNLDGVRLADLAQVNILAGENGSGKTSILEAIYMLSSGRSFRSAKSAAFIQRGQESCVIFGEFNATDAPVVEQNRLTTVGVLRSKSSASILKCDGRLVNSASVLARSLPLQLIHADSFELLSGGPAHRRQFLDWGVFHVEHSFHDAWKAFQRGLKQRNSLLRHGKMPSDEIAAWDVELCRVATIIDDCRRRYCALFAELFREVLAELVELDEVTLSYFRGWDSKADSLQAVLQQGLPQDFARGFTAAGPHRADLRIRCKGQNVADVLSRGQQKLVVVALRLAQGRLLRQLTGRVCVYLIDDLPSELDHPRRKKLCRYIEGLGAQVFITCVSERELEGCWTEKTSKKLFHVKHGAAEAVATCTS